MQGINSVRSTLLKNTEVSPFCRSSEKICAVDPFHTPLAYKKVDQLNLVSISLPVIPLEKFKECTNHLDENPLQLKVFTYDKATCLLLSDHFEKAITKAINEYDAHIICINELGMPLNEEGKVRQESIDFAKKMAQDNDCLIIAGSNHNSDSFLNSGYCFYPNDDKVIEEYKIFYKNISAVQENERIFIPPKRLIPYTRAFGIGISFIICLELVDFSSVSRIAQHRNSIDLLMVPTYLQDYGTMAKVAKNLSQAVGGVLLNNYYDNSRSDPPISRFYNHGIEEKNKARIDSFIDSQTKITCRKLDLRQFNIEKIDNGLNMSHEIKYLYGLGMIPR